MSKRNRSYRSLDTSPASKPKVESIKTVTTTSIPKKYELTDQIRVAYGRTFHRIRALHDFGSVRAGDFGGWIEKESNLSHAGICWVASEARVYGNAKIRDNALVTDSARVYGDAEVYDDARLYGYAKVYDQAKVYGKAQMADDGRVYGSGLLFGEAKVYGNGRIHGNGSACDHVRVFGGGHLFGHAAASENSQVYGHGRVYAHVKIAGDERVSNMRDIKRVVHGMIPQGRHAMGEARMDSVH